MKTFKHTGKLICTVHTHVSTTQILQLNFIVFALCLICYDVLIHLANIFMYLYLCVQK